MTIQELKDSKKIPSISDSELIKIINDMLKVQPEISDLNYSLEDSVVDKIKYSPAIMDEFYEQEMAKTGLDKSSQYAKVLKEMQDKQTELLGLSGYEEEKKYLQEKIQIITLEKRMLDSIMETFEKNKTALANNIDLKSLQGLDKNALALFMMGMSSDLQGLSQMLPLIQQLSSRVDQLYGMIQQEQTTVATPEDQTVESTTEEEKEIEVEAPPKPKIIPEQKPEVKVALNSLQDLKNKKKIPASLKNEEIIRYCNEILKFNPQIKDETYIFKQEQYDKLARSVFFQNAKVKSEIQHEHKGVIDKYSTLIDNYQSMLDRMKPYPEFASEVEKITTLMEELRTAQKIYKNTVVGLDAQNIEQYFDFAVSNREGVSSFVADAAKAITSSQEEKAIELDSKIATLTGQVERLEKVSDKHLVTRIRRNVNIKRLNNKIERLRQKQGKIKASQRRIINISTEMYKKRMQKEFEKFEREQGRLDYATQQKLNQVENLNAKKEEIESISRKITSLEEKRSEVGALGRMRIDGQKDRLDNRRKRVQAAVKRLETKIGKIDLSQQYQTSFNDNFAFAM